MDELEEQNIESQSTIRGLETLGEEVSEALNIIDERKEMINEQKTRINDFLSRLNAIH